MGTVQSVVGLHAYKLLWHTHMTSNLSNVGQLCCTDKTCTLHCLSGIELPYEK